LQGEFTARRFSQRTFSLCVCGAFCLHGKFRITSLSFKLFDLTFGMGGRSMRAERASDLRYNMEITLEEAFAGKTANLRLPTSVFCEACSGTGAKVGTRPKVCPDCGGAGRIRYAQGFFTLERTCAGCQGGGRAIDNPCAICLGAGRVTRERTLSVNIPPGVEDGTRIRVAGEGEAGVRGGPAGDLYVFLSIASHAFFQRDGADVHCRVPRCKLRSAASARCPQSRGARPA
jgi:molecular chaperone DnaJ